MLNRFSRPQLAVMGLATIPPLVVVGSWLAAALGLIPPSTAIDVSLGAAENPGIITFGAMFLATPVQHLTGRSQIRVRKYLGVVFFLLALTNLVMFVLEHGLVATVGAPFLIAGLVALGLAVPLFLTSSRWSQIRLGMRRWRLLHKLTYVIAIALVTHVLLIPDIGPGSIMIVLGFLARIPAVRDRLIERGQHRKSWRQPRQAPPTPSPTPELIAG